MRRLQRRFGAGGELGMVKDSRAGESGAEVAAVQTLRELDAARRSGFRQKAAICKMKEKNPVLCRDAATLRAYDLRTETKN